MSSGKEVRDLSYQISPSCWECIISLIFEGADG